MKLSKVTCALFAALVLTILAAVVAPVSAATPVYTKDVAPWRVTTRELWVTEDLDHGTKLAGVWAGEVSVAANTTTASLSLPGVLATDKVIATLATDLSTTDVYLHNATAGAGAVTVKLSKSTTPTVCKVSVLVFR